MAIKRALRGYNEYIEGDGETGGLVATLREAFKGFDSEDAKSKNEGRPVDRVSLFIEAETKQRKWSPFSREVSTSQDPSHVGAAISRALENDPGPSFEGELRTYIRIAGKSERLSPGSYQRTVATGFVSPDSIEAGNIVIPVAVWNQVCVPLLATVQQMATECARTTHESAQVIGSFGVVTKAAGDGIGAAVSAFKQTADNGLFGNVVKMLSGAATAGIPGAGQAAAVANGAQTLAAASFSGAMPVADRPALFGAGGASSDAPLPTFGPNAPAFGSTFGGTAQPIAKPQAQSVPGSEVNPATLTRQQIEAWAAANPTAAKNMVADQLTAKGAPGFIVEMVRS